MALKGAAFTAPNSLVKWIESSDGRLNLHENLIGSTERVFRRLFTARRRVIIQRLVAEYRDHISTLKKRKKGMQSGTRARRCIDTSGRKVCDRFARFSLLRSVRKR